MKTAEPHPKLTKAGTALRKFALGFPGAHEDFPWGHLAVKIGKKAFVFISGEGGATSMSAKLPKSHKAALAHVFAKPTEYGLGKHGKCVRSAALCDFGRSEEHTSELQSHVNLVCRLLLEKKKQTSSTLTT